MRGSIRFSCSALCALAALLLAPSALRAQARTPDELRVPLRLAGPWVGGTVFLAHPLLGDRAAAPWQRVGDFRLGAGASLALGYDRGAVGAEVAIGGTRTAVGGRSASTLSAAALVAWSPPAAPIAGWRSRILAGYVRLAIGGPPVAPSELPPGVLGSGEAGAVTDPEFTLLGNEARLGLAAERYVGTRSRLAISLAADVVHFGTATYDAVDQSLADPGWGVVPRLAVEMRVPVR